MKIHTALLATVIFFVSLHSKAELLSDVPITLAPPASTLIAPTPESSQVDRIRQIADAEAALAKSKADFVKAADTLSRLTDNGLKPGPNHRMMLFGRFRRD